MQIFKININTNKKISFERGKKDDSRVIPNVPAIQVMPHVHAQIDLDNIIAQLNLQGYNYNNPRATSIIHKKQNQNDEIQITKAKIDDFREIHKIDLEAFSNTDPVATNFENYKYEIEGLENFVVKDNSHGLIGYFQLEPIENDVLYINSIGIPKKLRHTKTSYKVLSKVRSYIKKLVIDKNVKKIALHVDSQNAMLLKLYQKYGFETKSTIKSYFENGNDANYMELDVEKQLEKEQESNPYKDKTPEEMKKIFIKKHIENANLYNIAPLINMSSKPGPLEIILNWVDKKLEENPNTNIKLLEIALSIKGEAEITKLLQDWIDKKLAENPDFNVEFLNIIIAQIQAHSLTTAKMQLDWIDKKLEKNSDFSATYLTKLLNKLSNNPKVAKMQLDWMDEQFKETPDLSSTIIENIFGNMQENPQIAKIQLAWLETKIQENSNFDFELLCNILGAIKGDVQTAIMQFNWINQKLSQKNTNINKLQIVSFLSTEPQTAKIQLDWVDKKLEENLDPDIIKSALNKAIPNSYYSNSQTKTYGQKNLSPAGMMQDRLNTFDRIFIKWTNEMISKKHILNTGSEKLDNQTIQKFVMMYFEEIDIMEKLLGEATLKDSFGLKLEGLNDLQRSITSLYKKIPAKEFERLIEILNPEKSQKYKEITDKTQEIRKENQQLAKIQELSIKKPQMDANNLKIKELKIQLTQMKSQLNNLSTNEKLQRLQALSAIAENNGNIPLIVLLGKDDETWANAINKKIFEIMGITFDQNVSQKLNLVKSKYLSNVLTASKCSANGDLDFLLSGSSHYEFRNNLQDLIQTLKKYPEKTVAQALNNLPQNIATKKIFEKFGIDYERWVNANKGSFVEVEIQTSSEQAKSAAIANLEADFNDPHFQALPKEETQKIIDTLKENGIELITKVETVYNPNGVITDQQSIQRLYFNNKPIEFNKLELAIKIIRDTINQNDFWSKECSEREINEAKNTIYNHFMNLRNNEIHIAGKINGEKTVKIKVRQTDMNDIPHSLFLGNHGACCTAVGTGCNQYTAPNYIKNKLISGIEILDGKDFIGNTMIYIAKVDGETSLVLDNIELNAKYQFNDNIAKAIIKYAEILTQDIGMPNMPIYAGPFRHKIRLNFPQAKRKAVIVGTSGNDKIYIDWKGRYTPDNQQQEEVILYKIK